MMKRAVTPLAQVKSRLWRYARFGWSLRSAETVAGIRYSASTHPAAFLFSVFRFLFSLTPDTPTPENLHFNRKEHIDRKERKSFFTRPRRGPSLATHFFCSALSLRVAPPGLIAFVLRASLQTDRSSAAPLPKEDISQMSSICFPFSPTPDTRLPTPDTRYPTPETRHPIPDT